MGLRTYQKDAENRNDAVKQILDGVDQVQEFRNNILAPLVASVKGGYGVNCLDALKSICVDADTKDMEEAANQVLLFQELLTFIDSKPWSPNLPE